MTQVKRIKLTGWKAVAALGVFLVVAIAHQTFIDRQLDEAALEKIRPFIQGEIITSALGGRDPSDLNKAELKKVGTAAMASNKVEFNNVTARGFGSDRILRVEITVDGKPPPDGRSVRYYRMEYSYLLGWVYHQEVTAFAYWTKLW